MLGFKTARCARILIAGIETMHMIRKGQLACPKGRLCPQHPSSTGQLSEQGPALALC